MDTVTTAAGVTAFSLLLAQLLTNRKLAGNNWPSAIPEHWPEDWRRRFVAYRVNPQRTSVSHGIRKRVKILCQKANRDRVRDFAWATRDGQKVTAGTMAWSHLLNTIKFCARNKNWGPWVYFVAEHRLRLRRCRKNSGQPTSKLTIAQWDERWEKEVGGPRRIAHEKKIELRRSLESMIDQANDGDYFDPNGFFHNQRDFDQ